MKLEDSEGVWPFTDNHRRLILEMGGAEVGHLELSPDGEVPRFNIYSSEPYVWFVSTTDTYEANLDNGSLKAVSSRPSGVSYQGCMVKNEPLPIPMYQTAERCPE